MFLWNLDYGLAGDYGELGYLHPRPVYEALAAMGEEREAAPRK